MESVKTCKHCGKVLERKRFNGRLEDNTAFRNRVYCNRNCMALSYVRQDAKTSALNKRARVFVLPLCQMCGNTVNLAVHHVDMDQKNNAPEKLMTLCGSCHTKWHWDHGKETNAPQKICACCDKPARHNGLCPTHRTRMRRYGNPWMVRGKLVGGAKSP